MPDQTRLAVRKSIVVAAPVELAFRVFTEEIGTWWPLATHSVMDEHAASVVMGQGIGGKLLETGDDGTEHHWGTVTDWEPPKRVGFTWHPGHPGENITHVDVTFTGEEGGTRVELVHTGWEVLGERAEAMHQGYTKGWTPVLQTYIEEMSRREV